MNQREPMNWAEACKAMRQGKAARRTDWPDAWSIKSHRDIPGALQWHDGADFRYSSSDGTSTYMVVSEE